MPSEMPKPKACPREGGRAPLSDLEVQRPSSPGTAAIEAGLGEATEEVAPQKFGFKARSSVKLRPGSRQGHCRRRRHPRSSNRTWRPATCGGDQWNTCTHWARSCAAQSGERPRRQDLESPGIASREARSPASRTTCAPPCLQLEPAGGPGGPAALLPLLLPVRARHATRLLPEVSPLTRRPASAALSPAHPLAPSPRSECITQAVRYKPQCPVCKSKVTRRDVAGDAGMDRTLRAFASVEAAAGAAGGKAGAAGAGFRARPPTARPGCLLAFPAAVRGAPAARVRELHQEGGGGRLTSARPCGADKLLGDEPVPGSRAGEPGARLAGYPEGDRPPEGGSPSVLASPDE
jgi:hypothetical protein